MNQKTLILSQKTQLSSSTQIPSKQIQTIDDTIQHFSQSNNNPESQQLHPKPYKNQPNPPLNPQITPFMRALKNWLIKISSQQLYCRQTYALCSYYIDSYLQRSSQVTINQLQIIGISCLFLAAKYSQGRQPKIVQPTFNRHHIIKLQKDICLQLNFLINHQTYVSIANRLLCIWDKFAEDKNINILYFTPNLECYLRSKVFFERLDCLTMVLRTNQFQLTQLVINSFYIQNKINLFGLEVPQDEQEFVNLFYSHDAYYTSFIDFLISCQCETQNILNKQLAKYLRYFYVLQCSNEIQQHKCKSFVQLTNLLTHNRKSYDLALSIIKKNQI